MKLDLKKFFQASNPSKTLVVSKPEDRQYYIDFSKVRGAKIIEELGRTITLLSEESTCQLFTGHIGCGKSTELLRLKAELEKQEFHVVYFESSQSLDMADIDVTDILLAIAREVSQSLEAIKINLKPGYFQNLFKEITDLLLTPMELSEVELSAGIAKITAKTKDSPKLRSQLRQYLEPRTNGILEAINQELLKPARDKLKEKGKAGLVVIIDNLDRVDNSLKPSGYYQPEYLFVERGEQLNQLNCHVIYTIPLILIFSNALGRLTNRFGVDPKVLPMVPVQLRDGSDFEEGITLLQKMIMVRAFPGVSWEQSQNLNLNLITQVFDSPDTLERICRVSGGHLRNLLMLLFRCLQREDPPLSRNCVESVIKQRCNELTLGITPDEWQLLREVGQAKSFRGHEKYDLLLRSMFVFEYRDDDGSWFDINPILTEAKEFR
ncbi:MAG: P-loop NTPase fold protein [Aulosira sp. ZfuVER01]|nr:AAA family ATPase [Aulosira sp. ZfuVER01]MDZ8002409.1 AAA family ATPase [Aulosira sp. DedVER01a]MDZ8054148.1 AAA family ATPase [Aulosira sp. ZfuCHP01]